jgi:hypothetical protein
MMKERIRELAEQTFSFKYKTAPDELNPGHTINDVEKFAELIVRECAEIAKHHVMNISTYADADFAEKQITENFGVK